MTEASNKGGRVVKDPLRYKTVLCNKFMTVGKCPYGPRCQFAHGEADLRRRQALQQQMAREAMQQQMEVEPKSSTEHTAMATEALLSQYAPLANVPGSVPLFQKAPSEYSEESMSCDTCVEDELPDVALNELTGEVVCRRDSSYNTQCIRRSISFLFTDEEAENMPAVKPLELQWDEASPKDAPPNVNPFGFDWMLFPTDSTPPGCRLNTMQKREKFLPLAPMPAVA